MSAEISYLLPKNKRTVWVPELEVMDTDSEPMIEIPLLGFITAGSPIERVEQNESIAVPQTMVSRNTYALKVRGHSMIDDNIEDGDVVIIEKTESATNGQSVVCLINNEQVTLKKFYIEKTGIRLQPANPDMEPIFLKNEEVQILGVVSGVVRNFH
ncbi:MAG: transcriptional repressor LexA [gamma proteobacterium symbiont of Lucinoma myriamae]|nr:transcriptional repressor LexA [gamma proteobacterium symbiont of Lucinoma myriamae]MCU7833591.1 transcriptional repressor LexA [gamma proteobacterium symbiont of Lucinoma myriamae]